MATPTDRLDAFLKWRGWKQEHCAEALHLHQTAVGRILRGARRPGVDVVHAIERVTSEPREDGTTWPDGPIRTEEWIEPSSNEADAAKPAA